MTANAVMLCTEEGDTTTLTIVYDYEEFMIALSHGCRKGDETRIACMVPTCSLLKFTLYIHLYRYKLAIL